MKTPSLPHGPQVERAGQVEREQIDPTRQAEETKVVRENLAPRDVLARLTEHLRNYRTPIRPKWAVQAADAIESYLAGRARSLDKAFGLTPKLGPPTKDGEHEAIARQAIAMRFAGKSWKDVADALALQKCAITDERTLRRLCNKWFPKIGAEMIRADELTPKPTSLPPGA